MVPQIGATSSLLPLPFSSAHQGRESEPVDRRNGGGRVLLRSRAVHGCSFLVLRYLRNPKLFGTKITLSMPPMNILFDILIQLFLISQKRKINAHLLSSSAVFFFSLSGYGKPKMRKSCLLFFFL